MVGIVNPPVVQRHPVRGIIPVIGRRRLQAVKSLGWQEILVRCISPDMPKEDGYRLSFWDNCTRINDPATRACVVKRLLELFSRDVVCSDFLPSLGIPPKGPRVERLLRVGGLERPILEALAAGRLLEKTAVTLSYMEEPDRIPVLQLAQSLRLNANIADEIVGGLHDLAVIQQRHVSEITASDAIRSLLEDRDAPIPQRTAELRKLLRSMRFPDLDIREREFRTWYGNLDVPPKTKIRHAPAFDTEECTIEVRTAGGDEARKILEALATLMR
jgi:ParB-like chromosome segregation protein Spo0J